MNVGRELDEMFQRLDGAFGAAGVPETDLTRQIFQAIRPVVDEVMQRIGQRATGDGQPGPGLGAWVLERFDHADLVPALLNRSDDLPAAVGADGAKDAARIAAGIRSLAETADQWRSTDGWRDRHAAAHMLESARTAITD